MITLRGDGDPRLQIKEKWKGHAKENQEISDMNIASSAALYKAKEATRSYMDGVYYQPVPEIDDMGYTDPPRAGEQEIFVMGLCPYYARVQWDGVTRTVTEWMSEGSVPWLPSVQCGLLVNLIELSKMRLINFRDSHAVNSTPHGLLYALGRAVHDLCDTVGNEVIKKVFSRPNPHSTEYTYSSTVVRDCTHHGCMCSAVIFFQDQRYVLRAGDYLEKDIKSFIVNFNSRFGIPAPLAPVRYAVKYRDRSGLHCVEGDGEEIAVFEYSSTEGVRKYVLCRLAGSKKQEIPAEIQGITVQYYSMSSIGRLKDLETYEDNQAGYSAKYYEKNVGALQKLEPYLRDLMVYAPGDGNGVAANTFRNVKSSDLHVSDLSSNLTYISTIRQEFRKFRQYKGPKVLVLGYVSTFISADVWGILDARDPVIIHDSGYVHVSHLLHGSVVGMNVVAYNMDIPPLFPDVEDVRYTTNLMGLTSVSSTTLDEGLFYLARVKPSVLFNLPPNWHNYWRKVGGKLSDEPGVGYAHTFDQHLDHLLNRSRSYFYLAGTVQVCPMILQGQSVLVNRFVYKTDSYAIASTLGDIYRRRRESYFFIRLQVGDHSKSVAFPGQVRMFKFQDQTSVKVECQGDSLYVASGEKITAYPLVKGKLTGKIKEQVIDGKLPSQMALWI